MKKIMVLFFTGMVVCQGLMATEPVSTSTPPTMGFEFKIDLHTPKSECTRYLGICKLSLCITVNFDEGSLGSGEVPCLISINHSNELVIQLSETNITRYDPALLKFFAGKTTVTFDDTYDITDEVSKGMQPQGRVVIRPGTYKLVHQDGSYSLIIPL